MCLPPTHQGFLFHDNEPGPESVCQQLGKCTSVVLRQDPEGRGDCVQGGVCTQPRVQVGQLVQQQHGLDSPLLHKHAPCLHIAQQGLYDSGRL